jgi:hypothetical protein
MIICVSAVSAADDANDDLAASDEDAVSVSNDDIVSASDSNTVLKADDNVANFNKLQGNITGAQSGYVKLSSSYKRNVSSESTMEIVIDSDIVIDGDSYTIDNSASDKPIFTITGGKVTLRNIVLKNVTDYAIINNGGLTLDGVTINGKVISQGTNSNLTISSSTFDDDKIELGSDTKLLSQADIIVKASNYDIVITTDPTPSSDLSAEVLVNNKRIVVGGSWITTIMVIIN